MRRVWWMLAATGVVVAVLGWWFQPAQVVKRRTATLVELMNMDSGRGVKVMDVHALNALLGDSIEVDAPFLGRDPFVTSPGEIESAYLAMGRRVKKAAFEVETFNAIRIDGDQAVVETVVKGLLEFPDIRQLDGDQRIDFHWQRVDGRWLLKRLAWDDPHADGR